MAHSVFIGLTVNFGVWRDLLAELKQAWEEGAESVMYTPDYFTFKEKEDQDQQAKEG